jgi:hypothetical protein
MMAYRKKGIGHGRWAADRAAAAASWKTAAVSEEVGTVNDRRRQATAGQAAAARIKVPEGMLEAVRAEIRGGSSGVEGILRAALEWLSRNPIRPTAKQVQRMVDYVAASSATSYSIEIFCEEWQRRMFAVELESAICQRVREAVEGEWLSADDAARLHEIISGCAEPSAEGGQR